MNIQKDIKFLVNAIKSEGKRYRVHYSKGNYRKESGLPQGTITIYSKDYAHLPKFLNPENDSDSMTDYFEKDRVRIKPSSPFYKDVDSALRKQELKNKLRHEKKMKKLGLL